jgi:hypothetical protein
MPERPSLAKLATCDTDSPSRSGPAWENFATVVEFSLVGFQDDKILRQWIESPAVPIVHTLIDLPAATFELIAFTAYEPEAYVVTWRRIVDIFRGKKVEEESIVPVTNVPFVWHSAVWKTFHNHPISAWYPGDNYVDWVAISWFAWSDKESRNVSETARSNVAAFAKEHSKKTQQIGATLVCRHRVRQC